MHSCRSWVPLFVLLSLAAAAGAEGVEPGSCLVCQTIGAESVECGQVVGEPGGTECTTTCTQVGHLLACRCRTSGVCTSGPRQTPQLDALSSTLEAEVERELIRQQVSAELQRQAAVREPGLPVPAGLLVDLQRQHLLAALLLADLADPHGLTAGEWSGLVSITSGGRKQVYPFEAVVLGDDRSITVSVKVEGHPALESFTAEVWAGGKRARVEVMDREGRMASLSR
jgi:hypothetical protein